MISSELTWVIPGVEASHLNEDTKVNITGSAQNRMKEVILENIVKIAAQNQGNILSKARTFKIKLNLIGNHRPRSR